MDERVRIVVADRNVYSMSFITRILQKNDRYEIVGQAKEGYEAIKLCQELKPEICLVNINLIEPDAFSVAEKIIKTLPNIGIIFVGDTESEEIIRKINESGVNYFIEQPYIKEKFYSVISKVYEEKVSPNSRTKQNDNSSIEKKKKVITVFSSKGGVGKSIVASNLAVSLAKKTGGNILLMDLDLQFGDIADLFGIDPKVGIIELINNKDIIDSSEFTKYTISHSSGIRILAAPIKPEQADLVEETHIKEFIPTFLKSFDYIVIDLPPLFNSQSLAAIENTDELFLICTPEVPTLKNVKGSLEILDRIGFAKDKIHLIANKYVSNGEIRLEDIKKFLEVEKVFIIDDNPQNVKLSINIGEPLVIKLPNSSISKQILNLIDIVLDIDKESGKTTQNIKLSKRKFFNRGG